MQQQTEQQIFAVPQSAQRPSIVFVQASPPAAPRIIFQASPSAAPRIIELYLGQLSIGLGIAQIIVGALCIVFNVVSIIFFTDYIAFIGHGIWCGIMFMITGGLGIAAGKTKKRCQIVSFNVMCILSASTTTVLIGLGIYGAFGDAGGLMYGCFPSCYGITGAIAMESIMAILAVIEAVVALCGSAICCKAACCCDCCICTSPGQTGYYYQPPNNGQVIYITQTQGRQPSYLAAQPVMQPGLAPDAPPAYSYPPSYASHSQLQRDFKI